MILPFKIQECEELASCRLPEEVPAGYEIRKLLGDASTRSYYRINNLNGKAYVLMRMPEPFDARQFAYLRNYELLHKAGVPLAEIYLMRPEQGWVFLQDLGDNTYYELFQQWSEPLRYHFYLKALENMLLISAIQPESLLAFDAEKLMWELGYFREHFLHGLRGIPAAETEPLVPLFRKLAEELAARPRVFCHRDYHSRNLMVSEEQVYVIDFQDARFGPATYDLASLCYDSYIQHSPEFLSHLEQLFFTHFPDGTIQRYEYPRMCLQRNLKALGTFGYQSFRLGREFYLQFVEPTLGYIRRHFEKLPEYAEMKHLLTSIGVL